MTDEKVRVRVTGRQFRHDGEEYHTGDTLGVTERAISGWEQRLERVDDAEAEEESSKDDGGDAADDAEAEDSGSDTDEVVSGAGLDPHPGDLTVAELEDRIEGVHDPELLHGIRDAEEADDDRDTAMDAIDARLSELEPEA